MTLRDVDGLQPTSYSLGGSVVYAVSRETNVLLELLHDWNETVGPGRILERERTLTLLPCIRQAINFQDAPGGQVAALILELVRPFIWRTWRHESNHSTDAGRDCNIVDCSVKR